MQSKTAIKTLAVTSLVAMGVSGCSSTNPYQASSMKQGYQQKSDMKQMHMHHKQGDKMGKHTCGDKMGEHACGDKKGEHSCSAHNDMNKTM